MTLTDMDVNVGQNSSYRGNLLQVAEFLTAFHTYYSWKDDIISLEDVHSALQYRILLRNHKDIEEKVFCLSWDNDENDGVDYKNDDNDANNPCALTQARRALKDSQRKIDERPKRDKHVHELLQRFEVWSTKALAQHVLLACTKPETTCASTGTNNTVGADSNNAPNTSNSTANSPNNQTRNDKSKTNNYSFSCWSTLLNLPAAAYFSDILPSAEGSAPQLRSNKFSDLMKSNSHHEPCSLMLPPNIHTWEEYLRLSYMVSLLPPEGRDEVLRSICCSCGNSGSNLYAINVQFRPTDLVALWVRAQRNNEAMRHLQCLFTFIPTDKSTESLERMEEENSGEVCQNNEQSKGNTDANNNRSKRKVNGEEKNEELKSPRSFRAVFKGNHKWTKRIITTQTNLVNTLVDWAVTNQVLIIYSCFRKSMNLSRNRVDDEKGRERKRKRTRLDQNDNQRQQILRCCFIQILRWFARRNRDALLVLFETDPLYLKDRNGVSAVDLDKFEDLQRKGISQDVHAFIEKAIATAEWDKTFSDIEGSIRMGKFDESDGSPSQFRRAVEILLNALRRSKKHVEPASIQAAIDDFSHIYESFNDIRIEDGLQAAAKFLLDPTHDGEEICKCLPSIPAPWTCHCPVCDVANLSEFRVCASCEKEEVHENCASFSTGSGSKKLLELVDSYSPLTDLCSIPQDEKVPDFTGARKGDIIWERKVIHVSRQKGQNGGLKRFGLHLAQTERCREHLDNIFSRKVRLSEPGYGTYLPLHIDHKGSIVTKVVDDPDCCGVASGFRVSDVIVGIEFVSKKASAKFPKKYNLLEQIDLSKLRDQQRTELFKLEATKLKVTVLRPNRNIIRTCKEWFRSVKESPMASINMNSSVWFCGLCRSGGRSSNSEDSESHIFKEAQNCRAVIRRLGVESYSVPFHGEEIHKIDTESKSHAQCVSLRRLDSMMSWILSSQSNNETKEKYPNSKNAFFAFPWSTGSGSGPQRLDWAPVHIEKKPMELLCRGIKLLLCRSQGLDGSVGVATKEQKREFFGHFVSLFSTWCVAPSSLIDSIDQYLGPPRTAVYARTPWIKECCSVCSVRAWSKLVEGIRICDGKSCENDIKNRSAPAGGNGRLPTIQAEEQATRYAELASLVGITLWVLPGDPMLDYVSKELDFPLEHHDRPLEFIVAAYLPPQLCYEQEISFGSNENGIFFLLPVLSQNQLNYLLGLCRVQQLPTPLDEKGVDFWINNKKSVLGLKGVVRVSWKELLLRMLETHACQEALTTEIARSASCINPKMLRAGVQGQKESENPALDKYETDLFVGSKEELCDLKNTTCSFQPDICLPPPPSVSSEVRNQSSPSTADSIKNCCGLIDSLMYSGSTVFLKMVNVVASGRPSTALHDSNSSETTSSLALRQSEEDMLMLIDDDYDSRYWAASEEGNSMVQEIDPSSQVVTHKLHVSLSPDCLYSLSAFDYNLCEMVYTDLYFTNLFEKSALENALREQKLESPPKVHHNCGTKAIVLSRFQEKQHAKNEAGGSYSGIGWGFELISWKHEKDVVRVGRVHPKSPAASSGLRAGDIVVSINSNEAISLRKKGVLPCAVLGASFSLLCHGRTTAALASLLNKVGATGPAFGPVVFLVARPQPSRVAGSVAASEVARSRGITPPSGVARGPTNRNQSQSGNLDPLPTKKLAVPTDRNLKPSSVRNSEPSVARSEKSLAYSPRKGAHSPPSSWNQRNASRHSPHPQDGNNYYDNSWDPYNTNQQYRGQSYQQSWNQSHDENSSYQNSWNQSHQADPSGRMQNENQYGESRWNSNDQSYYNRNSWSVPNPINPSGGENNYYQNGPSDQSSHVQNGQRQQQRPYGQNSNVQSQSIENSAAAGCATSEITATTNANATNQERFPGVKISTAFLRTLRDAISSSLSHRRPLSARHLYTRGLKGTVITQVETAVLLEAIWNEYPTLGMRMLCPRYELSVVCSQLKIIGEQTQNLWTIPRLSQKTWQFLLTSDYKRSEREKEGKFVFKDGNHRYRLPTEKLPLDRIIEYSLKVIRDSQPAPSETNAQTSVVDLTTAAESEGEALRSQTLQEISQHSDFAVTDSMPLSDQGPERIRGGGVSPGDDETSGKPETLADVPVSAWNKMLVSSTCETTYEGSAHGEAVLLGYVHHQRPTNSDDEEDADTVNVIMFYLSNVGIFAEPITQSIDPKMLSVVDHNSNLAQIAAKWKKGNPRVFSSMDAQQEDSEQTIPQATKDSESEEKCAPGNDPASTDSATVDPAATAPNPITTDSKRDEPVINKPVTTDTKRDEPVIDGVSTNDTKGSELATKDFVTEKDRVTGDLAADIPINDAEKKDLNDSSIQKPISRKLLYYFHSISEKRASLGELPDGRNVFWSPSDKNALYLGLYRESSACQERLLVACEEKYREEVLIDAERGSGLLRLPSKDMLCCGWGCSMKSSRAQASDNEREVLAFPSSRELHEHMVEHHSLCSKANSVSLEHFYRPVRIEGVSIVRLCTALTSAICARCSGMTQKATAVPAKLHSTSCGGDFVCSPVGSEMSFSIRAVNDCKKILPRSVKRKHMLARLLGLLSKILSLFDGNGKFRFEQQHLLQILFCREEFSGSQTHDDKMADGFNSCEMTSVSASLKDCELCTLDTERVAKSMTRVGAAGFSKSFVGVGCSLQSQICFPERRKDGQLIKSLGYLSYVKKTLLTVAAHVPEPLRFRGESSQKFVNSWLPKQLNLLRKQIWHETYFEEWRRFVMECINIQMLAQAFVVLLFSVHTERLPLWWKLEGAGWSSSQRIMTLASKSSLMLHLYVFDLALLEFESIAPVLEPPSGWSAKKHHLPKSLDSMSAQRRMEVAMERASSISLGSFCGIHGDLCCVCDDGGKLVCCEFCSNVQHTSCCDPPLTEVPETWVCDACIIDIMAIPR